MYNRKNDVLVDATPVSIASSITVNDVLLGRSYANFMFSLAFSSLKTLQLSSFPLPRFYSVSIAKLPKPAYLGNIRRLEIGTTMLECNMFSPYNQQVCMLWAPIRSP